MTKLYEINDKIAELFQTEEFDEAAFNALQMEKSEKVRNIGRHILSSEAQLTALGVEIKRLQARAKRITSNVDFLYDYLDRNIDRPYVFPEFEIKLKKNPPSVIVEDETLIPKKYFDVIPESKKLSLQSIKADINAGVDVPGAKLESKMSIKIG